MRDNAPVATPPTGLPLSRAIRRQIKEANYTQPLRRVSERPDVIAALTNVAEPTSRRIIALEALRAQFQRRL
jgi:hypothetical protein